MRALWLIIFFSVLIWSGINPKDQLTWFLEVLPAIIGFIILALLYNYYKFTTLVYILILINCIVVMIGGHYTYAEVPLFETIKEIFNQDRNNYDKMSHFVQGIIPAMILREFLIVYNIISHKIWRNFLIIFSCLGFSAFCELVEWWVAIIMQEGADAFLGMQGYEWDTQSDMLAAVLGASLALFVFGKTHDKQLEKKQNIS